MRLATDQVDCHSGGESFSILLMLDLDYFKLVNDAMAMAKATGF